jgi:hypothetical protein
MGGGRGSTRDAIYIQGEPIATKILQNLTGISLNRVALGGWVREAAEETPPLPRDAASAELREAGFELGPCEHGQAGIALEDGDERPMAEDREHGDRAILGVPPEPPRPRQRDAEVGLGLGRIGPEPLGESLD